MRTQGEKHVQAFRERHLAPDETILVSVAGFTGEIKLTSSEKQQRGVLLLTQRRVVFYSKGLIRENQTALERSAVADQQLSRQLVFEQITIRSGIAMIRFNTTQHERLKLLRDCMVGGVVDAPAPETLAAADALDARSKKVRGWAIASAAVIFLVFVVGVAPSSKSRAEKETAAEKVSLEASNAEKSKPEYSKLDAWVMARQFVKQQLKSPGTASFGKLLGESQSYDRQCEDLGNATYRCHGWVDAQNSFGANLRNNWAIKLKYVGNKEWRAIEGPTLKER